MKTIGRYIIRGLLGRGGMAKVYKVELPAIKKIAALKLLDPDPLLAKLIGIDRLRSLFTKEAITMAGIQHPNIAAIHDFDKAQGKPFYVMEYFANNLGAMMGESYQIERPSRVIKVDNALAYSRQILTGLDCLHDAGIVHRDIKPFNLLITAQDTIKICDFGLSKLRGEKFSGPSNLNVGSPYYAAPEQELDPDNTSPRADLFSVGVMLYRMLTGRLPISNPEIPDYLPPSRCNPDLDDHWDAFIAQAIAPQRPRRFASAKAMLVALNELSTHWQDHKEKSCALSPADDKPPLSSERPQTHRQRKIPIKARPSLACSSFKVDELWRPITYVTNKFKANTDGTITDHNTALIWQQNGSNYPRTWLQARTYIQQLNRDKFSDRDNWRLPTIDELITLLRPSNLARDLCIPPLFNTTQKRLWSIDRRSFMAAYYMDIELGFVGWQDFSAPYYVRAVCST